MVDIVSAIADETGEEPAEITPPLADVIDADALRQLFRNSRNDVRVTFAHRGREIDVQADGTVTIRTPAVGD